MSHYLEWDVYVCARSDQAVRADGVKVSPGVIATYLAQHQSKVVYEMDDMIIVTSTCYATGHEEDHQLIILKHVTS